MNFKSQTIFLLSAIFLSSCSIQMKVDRLKHGEERKSGIEFIIENTKLKTYQGWWVYGEGQHIFKDEKTLLEYDLEFPNENMQELSNLYVAVCEMEYFPMECSMKGYLKKKIFKKQNILVVMDFEILYVQGCE